MLERLKANCIFHQMLKRHDIDKAYAMVGPEDSWYDTITTVHRCLDQIRQLPNERMHIVSHDGLKLEAVYYPAKENVATVIWVHGYTSHAERESAFPGLFYHALGYNVLIPYLRAHGPSEGKYISFAALEAQDIRGWVQLLNRKNPGNPIILHGLSMGGGIVLQLADQPMENVCCLIADAPADDLEVCFRSIAQRLSKKHVDQICVHIANRFQKEFHADMAHYRRLDHVSRCRYPLFLVAGSNENMDEPLKQLQAHCPTETQVLILPGCNHGNGMYKQTELYQEALKKFIAKQL